MTVTYYTSTMKPIDVRTTIIQTDFVNTYPNGEWAPAVRVYSTTSKTTAATNGRKTRHKSRDSVGTPNWREIARKGLPLPFNNFSYVSREDDDWVGYRRQSSHPNEYKTSKVEFSVGSWYLPSYVRLAEGLTSTGCNGLMTSWDKSKVGDRALAKVIKRIRNQKIDLGVAMGEHKRTMALVAKNAIRIAGAIGDLKRGNFAGAANRFGTGLPTRARRRFDRDYVNRDRPKAISRAWLELQYGWKPLINDIYGACEQLAEQPRSMYQQCSGRAAYTNTIAGTYGVTSQTRFTESGFHLYEEQYVIRFGTANTAVQDINRLGLINPATVAWELMPWSFVIDWFLPVGNWLGSFNYDAGLVFIDGCKTTYEEIDSETTYHLFGQDANFIYDGLRKKKSNSVTVSRVKLFGFPPVPYPSFKNPVSRGHMLNAMALLTLLRK